VLLFRPILDYGFALIQKYPKMKQIVIDSYPYILIDARHPFRTDQFFLPLSRIDSMLRQKQPAAMNIFAHAAQHARIAGTQAVIDIRLRHFHLQRPEQRQIDRTHRPQKIRKYELAVMQHIYENIMYAELNTKSDFCEGCGYSGEILIKEDESGKLVWECPNCGSRDQEKMSVARRTCGYIGTQFWNQGRTQEIKDRVLHL